MRAKKVEVHFHHIGRYLPKTERAPTGNWN